VINFVSLASIEEKILDLIRFKKSLFTGVLDTDGDDVAMVGDSQFKKFMNSVASLTEELKKPDPIYEDQVRKEAERDRKAGETVGDISPDESAENERERDDGNALTALGVFLAQGAQILTSLSNALTQQSGHPSSGKLESLVASDEKTGETYLRIPLPEKETLGTVISALAKLIQTVRPTG
jgi:hypothetical protein